MWMQPERICRRAEPIQRQKSPPPAERLGLQTQEFQCFCRSASAFGLRFGVRCSRHLSINPEARGPFQFADEVDRGLLHFALCDFADATRDAPDR